MGKTIPLATPPDSHAAAGRHNAEGIAQYEEGAWANARDHFAAAVEADPNLPEAHFNLALTLDKLNRHAEATTHFRKAAELAPMNTAITQSSAYKRHTVPWSHYGSGGTKYMRVY